MYHLNKTATITKYLVENTTSKMRPAILILPGGSYLYTSPREAKPVATAYNAGGIHAFVLDYTVFQKSKTTNLENLLDEVKLAYDYIVSNHQEFQVDVNKIFIIGFSAGGHLAAAAINKYPKMFQKAVLAYPALNLVWDDGKYDPTEEVDFIVRMFKDNLILDVTKDNPPTFIWHTVEDEVVPIEGSIEYIDKLKKKGIPFEAHFYEKGWHGLSIANEIVADEEGNRMDLHASTWVDLSISWLLG